MFAYLLADTNSVSIKVEKFTGILDLIQSSPQVKKLIEIIALKIKATVQIKNID